MKLEEIGFYTLTDARAKNSSKTSQMKRCEMIITEVCNFNCPYCRGLTNEIYGNRKVKELSLNEIKSNIDIWCKDIPLENIRFSGGEPTLHKDIIEIIAYAKHSGIKRIALSTNGTANTEFYKKLIEAGVNDYSISLDACCAEDIKKMSGGVNAWNIIRGNIIELSKLTYITVGIVLTKANISETIKTIRMAHEMGVADIRIISAAQFNKPITQLEEIEDHIRLAHPILNYRIKHFLEGRNVRGINRTDSNRCGLVLDDSIIAGEFHFPCVIYMREGGKPIGKVSEDMRAARVEWFKDHKSHEDSICRKMCLDVCIDYNNKFKKLNT